MNDRPVVYDIVREAYSPYIPRIGRKPAAMSTDFTSAVQSGELFVAECDGAVVGVMRLRPHEAELEVSSVAVRPTQHRRGVGTRFIAFAEDRARLQNFRQLVLYTNAALGELVDYYHRQGFAVSGRRVDDGLDRVFMRKAIVDPLPRSRAVDR